MVRGAEGLGETVYFPASMSLISDYHSKRTRSRAMSLHQTSVYAGTIGGGALAGWMGQHYGWQSPFILLGAAGVVLGSCWPRSFASRGATKPSAASRAWRPDEPIAPPIPIWPSSCAAWSRTPSALLLILGFLGANSVGMVFLTWMPTFMKEKFELSLALAGVTATIYLQVRQHGRLAARRFDGRWPATHDPAAACTCRPWAPCAALRLFSCAAARVDLSR